jgi:methylthioribose-1-phosphate isomerase
MDSFDSVRAIRWQGDRLHLLDQRVLPHQQVDCVCCHADEVVTAIRDMVVRGAPAIGVAAAFGVVLAAQACHDTACIHAAIECLAESRPTAVNLFWALQRMRAVLDAGGDALRLEQEALAIYTEDVAANRRMGELGAALIEPGEMKQGLAVLTHCNTGSLATAGYGTALGVIRSAYAQQRITHVFADETRPWLQGARLTAWELQQDGIPLTLICEGAAASLLRTGQVGWVIVGADRITANGDTANKIGTYGLAILARQHGVKFMVVAPSTTFDLSLAHGGLIPIETRPMSEVTSLAGVPIAPAGVAAWNPSFDVTPADLIDAIVTERGVIMQPTTEQVRMLLG